MNTPPIWLERLYLLLALLMPWTLEYPLGSSTLNLPVEPLLLLTGLLLPFALWPLRRSWLDMLRRNPLWLLPAAWMCWMTFCLPLSSMPTVSVKYWIAEAGQFWVFGVGLLFFPPLWRRMLPLLALSAGVLVLYTLAHHSQYHFRSDQSPLAPMPFFPDHTIYSAFLALLLPWVAWSGLVFPQKPQWRVLLAALLLAGIVWSFCRASWLEVLAMAGLALLMFVFWKKGGLFVGLALLVLLAGVFFLKTPLETVLKEKIRTDVSSMERLNRYSCAWRMAADRPLTGFGPGTYQFVYLNYQRPEEMTRLSVQEPVRDRNVHTYGRGGGAHSEYLQALSETGWPGLLLWGFMALAGSLAGIGAAVRQGNRLLQALHLSLFGYFLHAAVNNFVHDARIAFLLWGSFAVYGAFKYRGAPPLSE